MADLNVAAIKAKVTANITTNGIQDITGAELAEILNDLADSSVNKTTNAALLGLSEHDPTRVYLPGVACLTNGILIQALVQTTGTLNASDWEVIYSIDKALPYIILRDPATGGHRWKIVIGGDGMPIFPGEDLGV